MGPLTDRIAELKRVAKSATAIGFALLDTPLEVQIAALKHVLPALPPGKSKVRLLLVAHDHAIEIDSCHQDEQASLIAERARRKAKAEATRIKRTRENALAEEEKALFEKWKQSQRH